MILTGRPPKYTDPEKLEADIKAYFDHCESTKREFELKAGGTLTRYEEPPSMIGLALWLDVSKVALYKWLDGEYMEQVDERTKERFLYLLSRARDRIEQTTLARATTGDYQPKIAAMVLTNMGYEKPQDDRAVVVKIQGAGTDEWSK